MFFFFVFDNIEESKTDTRQINGEYILLMFKTKIGEKGKGRKKVNWKNLELKKGLEEFLNLNFFTYTRVLSSFLSWIFDFFFLFRFGYNTCNFVVDFERRNEVAVWSYVYICIPIVHERMHIYYFLSLHHKNKISSYIWKKNEIKKKSKKTAIHYWIRWWWYLMSEVRTNTIIKMKNENTGTIFYFSLVRSEFDLHLL